MKRVLVFSLVLNLFFVVVLVGGAWFSRELLQEALLEPLYERDVSMFDSFPVEPGDVVFLGDSLLAGAALNEMFPNVPVRNRAIIADTSEGVLDRLGQIIDARPAAVVLMIGTFDMQAGIARRTTIRNVDEILEILGAEVADARVVLVSVLPRQADFTPGVQRLNSEYARIAEERGVVFLDVTASFAASDGTLAPELTNDGLHLLGSGYVRLAELLRPELQAYVRPFERHLPGTEP